jgi:hypothetical protein
MATWTCTCICANPKHAAQWRITFATARCPPRSGTRGTTPGPERRQLPVEGRGATGECCRGKAGTVEPASPVGPWACMHGPPLASAPRHSREIWSRAQSHVPRCCACRARPIFTRPSRTENFRRRQTERRAGRILGDYHGLPDAEGPISERAQKRGAFFCSALRTDTEDPDGELQRRSGDGGEERKSVSPQWFLPPPRCLLSTHPFRFHDEPPSLNKSPLLRKGLGALRTRPPT